MTSCVRVLCGLSACICSFGSVVALARPVSLGGTWVVGQPDFEQNAARQNLAQSCASWESFYRDIFGRRFESFECKYEAGQQAFGKWFYGAEGYLTARVESDAQVSLVQGQTISVGEQVYDYYLAHQKFAANCQDWIRGLSNQLGRRLAVASCGLANNVGGSAFQFVSNAGQYYTVNEEAPAPNPAPSPGPGPFQTFCEPRGSGCQYDNGNICYEVKSATTLQRIEIRCFADSETCASAKRSDTRCL